MLAESKTSKNKIEKIAIGLLAHNESKVIGKTIDSIFRQTLFQGLAEEHFNYNLELFIIPNGCTDDTAEVAKKHLSKLEVSHNSNINFSFDIHPLAQSGKTNAWNFFVHNMLPENSNYVFLMDADIELHDPRTLSSMVMTLRNSADAWVVVDKLIKNIALKENKNLLETLSLWIAGLSGGYKSAPNEPAWLCGQLYCARPEILRQIWLPVNLPTQDAFLYEMVTTNLLKDSVQPNRVVMSAHASHIFEAYTQLDRLFRHEKWLIIGSSVTDMLLREFSGQAKSISIGKIIEKRNEEDSNWLNDLVSMESRKRLWLIPRFIFFRRFISLRQKKVISMLVWLPISIIAFLADVIIAFKANQDLRSDRGIKYWGK